MSDCRPPRNVPASTGPRRKANRKASCATDPAERERLKRLADRHAVAALHHEKAAEFQSVVLQRSPPISSKR